MFFVLLKFSTNKALAADHMAGHNAWLAKGFDDGVFLVAGGIKPGIGGAILAAGGPADALQARINADPFVVHDVVTAEISEIDVKKTAPSLDFLLG